MSSQLWAVHAQGSDDIYPAFDKADAEKHAAELNALPMPAGIAVNAVVIPSPWKPVEHWEFLAQEEREHKEQIMALSAQPQASAAQSAPAGEREAFDKWFRAEQLIADHIDTTFISSAFLPYKAFQAGASWQRTQAAGVPEGWRPVPVASLERMWRFIDPAPMRMPNGDTMTFQNPHAAAALREISAEFRAMLAAAPAQGQQVERWIPVSERLPACGRAVLAYYLNRQGMGRRIRAEYVTRWTVEAEMFADPDTECVEYSEQDDTYYVTEGWYELIDNWDEYARIAVNEGVVTSWMPLPAAPTHDKQSGEVKP